MTYDAPPPFVSAYGFQDLIGTRKTAFEDGFCRLELDLAPCHMNRALIPHGGVYACLLDTALGAAGVYAGTPNDFHPAVTLKLNISYLASPDDGRRVAKGRRIGGGRTICFSEGQVADGPGLVVARASGTFRPLRRPADGQV